MKSCLVALIAIGAAFTATAQGAAPPVDAAGPPAPVEAVTSPAAAPPVAPGKIREGQTSPDGTKVVCRREAVMGTRLPKRICKSKAAWKEYDTTTKAAAKEATDKLQRNKCGGEPGRC